MQAPSETAPACEVHILSCLVCNHGGGSFVRIHQTDGQTNVPQQNKFRGFLGTSMVGMRWYHGAFAPSTEVVWRIFCCLLTPIICCAIRGLHHLRRRLSHPKDALCFEKLYIVGHKVQDQHCQEKQTPSAQLHLCVLRLCSLGW